MSGIHYLVDTNCFIYLLNEQPAILQFTEGRWFYSFITEMELLSKKGLATDIENTIRNMLAICIQYGHNQSITELTITLRRNYSLKFPDAIIAATAIHLNIPLLTADKSFAPIKELDCVLLEL